MIRRKRERESTEINAGSMADIAFLLLIFFLVTTTIVSDSAIPFTLPEKVEKNVEQEFLQKNIFKVLVNSNDDLLVEDDRMDLLVLRKEAITFLTNNGKDPKSSDNPKKAIVSYKADRGTSYEMYINVLDELKAAYHTVRAQELGISVEKYLALDKEDKEDKKLLKKASDAYPMQLSIAEPTSY